MDRRRDNPLAKARRRLTEAVAALAEPVPIWDSGVCRYTEPTYTRLRGALRGQPTRSVRRIPSLRLPCRGDVLALLLDIDATTAQWEPHGKSTLERLRQIAAQDRRPEDCPLLDDYRTRVQGWVLNAAELLGDKPAEVALRLPCRILRDSVRSPTVQRRDRPNLGAAGIRGRRSLLVSRLRSDVGTRTV